MSWAREQVRVRAALRSALLLLLCALFAAACDLAEDDLYALRITSPRNGQTFTDADDADLATHGMQIALRVETTEQGVPIELLRFTGATPEVITRKVTAGRSADFPSVTLFPGANLLVARDARSGRTSLPITLYFEDPCGSISFIEPAPPALEGAALLLGPLKDGSCGESYTIELLAATGLRDGTRVSVLIDGDRVASGTTRGGALQIPKVPLEKRDGEPFVLALLVEDNHCAAVPFPAPVVVDCEGPTCALSAFEDRPYTSEDDRDDQIPGLNLDISVQTSADGASQPVELIINGDQGNALRATPAPGTHHVTFAGVPLPDGSVRVTAVCRDRAGASATSQRILRVDTSGCSVSVTSPLAGTSFVAAEDGESLDVQVTAALGSDCASARFSDSASADCGPSLAQAPFQAVTLGQTTITADVTLTVHGQRFLCVGTRDASANESVVAVPITFENKGPNLSIATPLGPLRINRDGDDDHLADGDPKSSACEQPVEVTCALDGKAVRLVRMPDKVTLAETPCVGHRASFASVPFPSQNDGTPYWVEARTTSDKGLIGRSASLEVYADCEPPHLSFPDELCGLRAITDADDEDPALAGIQHTLRIRNAPNPKPAVTLTLAPASGAPSTTLTSDVHDGPDTLFQRLTLPPGVSEVRACASDAAGNTACTPICELLVGDAPVVTFAEPAQDGAVFGIDLSSKGVDYRSGPPAEVDCDAAAGLQLPVRAVIAGAPPGRAARVRLEASDGQLIHEVLTTVDADHEVQACLNTRDGSDLVLRVEVDAASADQDGLYGAAERRVNVSTQAPALALSATAGTPACRGPSTLFFDAPIQNGTGEDLSFELRCASSPIDSHAAWEAAYVASGSPRVSVGAPAAAGNSPTLGMPMEWTIPPMLPGETRHCSVRGYDRMGAYTPLAASLPFASPALRQRAVPFPDGLGGTSGSPAQVALTALGDVNGDGFDDLLVSGGVPRTHGTAALYLGHQDGFPKEPSASFTVRDAYDLGRVALALGNFDGDPAGLMDFALAAPLSGRVFVVLGRRDFEPGTYQLDAGGCGADLCLVGDEQFGRALGSTRFDPDAIADLAIADSAAVTLILGGTRFEPVHLLGASGAGRCLDLHEVPRVDACGNGTSMPAGGLRVRTERSIDHLLGAWPGALFLAHAGEQGAPALWRLAGLAYPSLDALIEIDSAALSLVHQPAAAMLPGNLAQLGDLDGDGIAEIGWAHGAGAGRVQIYRRSAGTLTPSFELLNDLAGGGDDGFGLSVASGAHPELGQYGDLDGDDRADLMVSALPSLHARGSVEVFNDLYPFSGSLPRSARALHFDDHTLIESDAQATPYRRLGQWIGDVDGDGQPDLAVLEPDHASGQGRLIVLGECGP